MTSRNGYWLLIAGGTLSYLHGTEIYDECSG
jgi:hypothetical protein